MCLTRCLLGRMMRSEEGGVRAGAVKACDRNREPISPITAHTASATHPDGMQRTSAVGAINPPHAAVALQNSARFGLTMDRPYPCAAAVTWCRRQLIANRGCNGVQTMLMGSRQLGYLNEVQFIIMVAI